MKILNLYAGIGGNHKLWGNEHDITAIEINPKIASIYKDHFPEDKVIVGDAHAWLLDHYKEYNFIWSSPPCPTHSRVRKITSGEGQQNKPIYPSMKLYEEILFLKGYFKGKWVVENVVSWYKPLIRPYEVGAHYYWSNFVISGFKKGYRAHDGKISELEKIKGFDLSKYTNLQVDKKLLLRNCVEPEFGLHVFNCAFKEVQATLI